MRNKLNFAKKALQNDWYIQGFNARPIFLNLTAWSGFEMKKIIGFGYSSFIHKYQNGYGEMGYLNSDFKRIWKTVNGKFKKDKNYLIKIKSLYVRIFKQYNSFFAKIDKENLEKLTGGELLSVFKKCAKAQIDSGGVAHIIDAVGIVADKDLIKYLSRIIPDKSKFNIYFGNLTAPAGKSFIAREEADLLKIKRLPALKQGKVLREHLKKYFWIQNSYAGPVKIQLIDLKKRIKIFKEKSKDITIRKSALIKQLGLTRQTKELVKFIEFITIWQDQRKANILKVIGYLGLIIDEIASRLGLNPGLLYYLGVNDIAGLTLLDKLKSFKSELASRKKGCYFFMANGQEYCFTGSDYKKLLLSHEKENKTSNTISSFHGISANKGTARGRVIICKGIDTLKKVKKGDILVSSMTRPEYIMAIKKSAAIITDEGGITSHAAIISRELNIPCVIGTKIATKILRSGDLVEVRANHGIINILKKKG